MRLPTRKLYALASALANSSSRNGRSMSGAACRDGVCRPPSSSKAAETSSAASTSVSDAAAAAAAATAPSNSSQTKIKIKIISDTMCPWCWVGRRNLGTALEACADTIEADIEWLPFFLDRYLPEEGKPVRAYYAQNYCNPEAGEEMKPHLLEAGRRVGIDFDPCYNKLERYRPTIRSHRLIEYAKRCGKQEEMVERLFQLYYIEGGHLNSVSDLAKASREVLELDRNEDIEKYLQSDEDEADVDALAQKYLPMASGVPTFLISRKDAAEGEHPYRLSGARAPGAFITVFSELASDETAP